MAGFGGDDWLSGEGGNDTICGDADSDALYGKTGADRMDGGSDEGDAFVLIDVRGSISAEVQGMSVPLASWERVTDPVPYRVAGGRLTYRFAMPDGATVELTYRAA